MMTDTRNKIIKYISQKKQVRVIDLVRYFGFSAVAIHKQLRGLAKDGVVDKTGKPPKVFYVLAASKDISKTAMDWVYRVKPPILSDNLYCPTRDIFQARLETMISSLEQELKNEAFLLGAIAGEIGNNSFDHNLGRWRDTVGIFFSLDKKKKIIILADRGVGVLATIKNVLPKIKDDQEALKLAFTKIISGRKGEHRGNGLKFVANVLKEKNWQLEFSSGKAQALLRLDLSIKKAKKFFCGCLAVIKY